MAHLADTPVLQTERLTLRAPQSGDWPAWRDFAASERAGFIGGPYDLRGGWRSFGHAVGHWVLRGFGSFVFTFRGEDRALGMAGPWYPADWPERELGWTIWSPENEGRGIAFEAVTAARDHAFRVLGWDTAVSYIEPANTRSVALAKRLGARRDDQAARPGHCDCQVYRHPAPEDAP